MTTLTGVPPVMLSNKNSVTTKSVRFNCFKYQLSKQAKVYSETSYLHEWFMLTIFKESINYPATLLTAMVVASWTSHGTGKLQWQHFNRAVPHYWLSTCVI